MLSAEHWLEFLSPVNALGAMGVALGASWALFRRRAAILGCQALCSLSFALHYVLLGSLTGATMCGVSVAQSLLSRSAERRPWHPPLYLATVLVILAMTYATWGGLPSLGAGIGAAFATLGRLQRDVQRMRFLFLGCSCSWAVHNFLVGSLFGNVCDALTVAGILVGILRHAGWRPRLAVPRLRVGALRLGAAG